jgi:hypothetical protein
MMLNLISYESQSIKIINSELYETFVSLTEQQDSSIYVIPHSQMAHRQICNVTMLVYKYTICRYIQIFAQSMQTDMLFVQLIAPFTAQRGVFLLMGDMTKAPVISLTIPSQISSCTSNSVTT